MAALAVLLRQARRAYAHARGLPLFRVLSTTTASSNPGTTTGSSGRRCLRREFNSDRAVSILKTMDMASMSASGTRNALSVTARRLFIAGRVADAEALISSYLTACTTEPYLAAVLCSCASANLPEKALDTFRSATPSLPTPMSALPHNALLFTFLRCHRHHRIAALFTELSKEFSITPNDSSYDILVKAYCMNRDDAKAK
jgi:hypothetical protein